MLVPTLIEPQNGQFAAKLVGQEHVCVMGASRDEALAAMKSELPHMIFKLLRFVWRMVLDSFLEIEGTLNKFPIFLLNSGINDLAQ